LSDGKEAGSSVQLKFGDVAENPGSVGNASIFELESSKDPDPSYRIRDLAQDEFKMSFNAQTWSGKVNSSAVLTNGNLSILTADTATDSGDYCIWRPDSEIVPELLTGSELTEKRVSVSTLDKNGPSPTSIVFHIDGKDNERIGKMECAFHSARVAQEIDFKRWQSVVGPHITIRLP
jgi:hypothetical protein